MKHALCNHSIRRAILAMVSASVLLAGAATAQEATAPATPLRVGLVVFIASQGEVEAALSPGELRGIVEGLISNQLTAEGDTVFGTVALGPAVQQHRVRTSLLANQAFLEDLAVDAGLDRLVLVDLIILPNNLMLASREVSVPDGVLRAVRLADVNLEEEEISAEEMTMADRWRESLSQLCAGLDRTPAVLPVTAVDTLAVLPFEAHGADKVVSLVASVMLLDHALRNRTVTIPDPALIITTLQDAGLDAHLLSAEGRAMVVRQYACSRIIHPVVVSYAESARTSGLAIPDFANGVHQDILLASGILSLLSVDPDRGNLFGSTDLYFELREQTGWFGIRDKRSAVVQLEAAIEDLWSEFAANLEDY